MEQNLFADEDVFAFVRSLDGTGCAADHLKERFLILVNKAQRNRVVRLPMKQTALAGCTTFLAVQSAAGLTPSVSDGKLCIEEQAESMTVYEAR